MRSYSISPPPSLPPLFFFADNQMVNSFYLFCRLSQGGNTLNMKTIQLVGGISRRYFSSPNGVPFSFPCSDFFFMQRLPRSKCDVLYLKSWKLSPSSPLKKILSTFDKQRMCLAFLPLEYVHCMMLLKKKSFGSSLNVILSLFSLVGLSEPIPFSFVIFVFFSTAGWSPT